MKEDSQVKGAGSLPAVPDGFVQADLVMLVDKDTPPGTARLLASISNAAGMLFYEYHVLPTVRFAGSKV